MPDWQLPRIDSVGELGSCLELSHSELSWLADCEQRRGERDDPILSNCIRDGLDAQNLDEHPDFREHLRGRVAYVEQINPRRGARLRALFARIGQ